MLEQLRTCLRVVLNDSDARIVPLQSELEVLNNYVLIQTTRFGNRLRIKIDTEPGTGCVLIPRLILQPIVENAIEHGIGRLNGAGEVSISAKRNHETLQLTVKDSGPGARAGFTNKTGGKGIGLSVTRQRLQQIYGSKHRLQIGNAKEGGFFVQIDLPWQEAVKTG
jgi:sensor histidine kinase YesM